VECFPKAPGIHLPWLVGADLNATMLLEERWQAG